ncbi:MAG: LamG domain-containing protein [Planctomycetes bacterium]|nr:LamG domain-containing protein [Planctomycetota bacterium]
MCKKSKIRRGGLICLVSFVLVLGLALTSVVEAAADPSLLAWWKLDEGMGVTVLDWSGLGNGGTLANGPQWVPGNDGGALYFDGTDDYVDLGTPSELHLPDNYTYTAWFKVGVDINGDSGAQYLLCIGSRSDLLFGVEDGVGVNGDLSLHYYDTAPSFHAVGVGQTVWSSDEWHMVAGTKDSATGHKIYLDGELKNSDTNTNNDNHATSRMISLGARAWTGHQYFNGTIDDVRIYNRALTQEEIRDVMVGTLGLSSNPSPADDATDVPREVTLSWTPGEFAAPTNGHKVYFGQSFNDVNDATDGITQDANSYALPQRFDFGTTYYWRVDEVNAPPTSQIEFKGKVWQFTTEPIAYPIDGNNITATASSTHQSDVEVGPENTINGSGLDANDLHSTEAADMWLSGEEKEPNRAWIEYELDKVYKLHEMWVWNANQMIESIIGFGFKDVTIEYSTNGTDYTILGTTHEFARAPGTADYAYNTTIDFGGAAAKYIRLTANSNWGGLTDQYGLSEVRFFSIPVFAREPSPDSGATNVSIGTTDNPVDVTLGFRAGREAAEHNVYFSTDEQAVIDGNVPVSTVTEASYDPLSLDLGKTYYWKINEVNEAETPTTWQGDIWNFSTPEFFVVDGFEDYNDYPPNEIWATWIDGYGIPANGATSGYPAPDWNQDEHYVETAIVHGGSQSMPFFYDNTGTATYSEGERTFAVPQDWTKAGIQTLALYFFGTAGNTGQLYVKVNGSKVVYDGDAADIQRAGWQAWNIELASFGVDLQSVTTLAIGIDDNGASGTLYFDDIRPYPYSRQFITPTEPNNAGLVAHWKLDEGTGTTANDISGNGHHGTLTNGAQWTTGNLGGAVSFDGTDDYVSVPYSPALNPADSFTISVWAMAASGGTGYRSPISSRDGSPSEGYIIYATPSDIWQFWTGPGWHSISGPSVRLDSWVHLTAVFSAGTKRFYVDGILAGEATGVTYNMNDRQVLLIGAGANENVNHNYFFEGSVDEVRLYDYALSYGEASWLAGRTEAFDKPF